MNKRTKVLQFLFLLIIIITSNETNLTGIIDPYDTTSSSYVEITDINDTTSSTDIIETLEEKSKRLCGETQPLKGIKEECYQEEIKNSNNEVCCYMTIKYETSEHFECIPVNKNLAEIKNKIKEIKQNYEGSKSINIDCNSSLIRITLISFLLFLLF